MVAFFDDITNSTDPVPGAAVYRRVASQPSTDPWVRFDTEMTDAATLIEVHATDAIGLLYRVTRVLSDLDLDIRSATISTLGDDVVDSFYVVDGAGRPIVDPDHLAEIELHSSTP